jgi:hypothetical protein
MTRTLTTAVANATLADVVRPFYAVALDFAGGWVRANSTPYTLTIDGASFIGVGKLGGVAPVEETGEATAAQMAVALWGVPRELVGIALAEHYQGRRGYIWFGTLDEAHQVIASPYRFFSGRIDTMAIELGDTASVAVTLENRLADWDRDREKRYTNEEQQSAFDGDLFFQYVPKMQDLTLKWGRS